MIKLLTITSLYPDSCHPRHGIFVETRLRQLLKTGKVKAHVIAPVPWLPFSFIDKQRFFRFSTIPVFEEWNGIKVHHPRFFTIPGFLKSLTPVFMALTIYKRIRKKKLHHCDIIDAHYFYPDGVAATIVAMILKKKLVITARGSDINYFPKKILAKLWIKWAAKKADKIITVSNGLQKKLLELGVSKEKIVTIRNGVNLELFHPSRDRISVRKYLKFKKYTLLSVGNLITLKGHDLVIKAVKDMPEVELIIIGSGVEKKKLKQLVEKLQINNKVKFINNLTQKELKNYYCAADALVLASSSEGWPNVLLESMACGTPVVVTDIDSAQEIITSDDAGVIVHRTVKDLMDGINFCRKNIIDRDRVRAYAEQFSWKETCDKQIVLFNTMCH